MNAPEQVKDSSAATQVFVALPDGRELAMEDGKPAFNIVINEEGAHVEVVTQDGATSTYSIPASDSRLLWAYFTRGLIDHLKRALSGVRSAAEFEHLRSHLAEGPDSRRPRSLTPTYTILEQSVAEATGRPLDVVRGHINGLSAVEKRKLGRDPRVAAIFARRTKEEQDRLEAKRAKSGTAPVTPEGPDLLSGLLEGGPAE